MGTRKAKNFGLIAVGALAGVLISLGISAVAQRGAPLPLDELRQFSSVFAAIKNNYVEDVEDKELIKGAISGMLSDLDPHSAYLDADAFKEMQDSTQGQFGGLGIEVGTEDGFVKVISPIEDTPAARADIRAGDLIVRIDGNSTKGLALTDAVKLMRGEPGTKIRLTIMREGLAQPLEVTLERAIINVRSVRSKLLDDNVAYVRIAQFQEKTGNDLVQHLKGFTTPPSALILDLRNDPGGLLGSAIGVSSAFLDKDVLVVSTDGRAPDSQYRYMASPSDYARGRSDYLSDLPAWAKTVPMVVLVNVGSASASEIVAGALQDYKRATVMGNRSFGKGSVQVILPISEDTAIKLTTSRYYTPAGRSIQATGIEPDITVPDTAEGDLFIIRREADLRKHLSNQQVEEESTTSELPWDEFEMPQPFELGGDDDFQLRQALNHLKGKPIEDAKPRRRADVASHEAHGESGKVERLRVTPEGVQPQSGQ
ncbi:S41 family peptidase [Corticimicrobacter populi]|uniref:S41 family peptidase n=1 Tax=Corticimicrobacter populi TaxID=2175229 RepID=A0A2V1K2J3_9BURK|nr:S41 family peptidase [Corticimicrobacter populi]PWF23857.1 S41 family peptidase [Corticimicrobacter populi]